MHTYISILRGINVGGKRIIKMAELKEMCVKLGFTNIATFIQSGNVIFQAKKFNAKELSIIISTAIVETFGFDVPVIVMELKELQKIKTTNPFLKDSSKAIEFLHVTFLSDIPIAEEFNKIKQGDYKSVEFYIIEKAIYLYCPDGYSNSKLTNGFLENKLKVTATTRNWKTINELIAIGESLN